MVDIARTQWRSYGVGTDDPFFGKMKDLSAMFEKVGALAEPLQKVASMPTFETPKITVPRPAVYADTMYERLVLAINEFEAELEPNEEIGARVAHFGQAITIAIDGLSSHNPYLIKIHGTTQNGDRCTLLQHMNQVSILLVALPAKHDPPRRIGFKLDERAADEEDQGSEDEK